MPLKCPGAPGAAPATDPNQARLESDGNNFLKTWVSRITSSKAWTGNSTIFVVWDENNYTTLNGCCDSPFQPQPPVSFTPSSSGTLNTNGGDLAGSQMLGGGHVPMIVISRRGRRGATDSTPFNHYSLLQTIEADWNLPYLGYASDTLDVKPLTPLFAPVRRGDRTAAPTVPGAERAELSPLDRATKRMAETGSGWPCHPPLTAVGRRPSTGSAF